MAHGRVEEFADDLRARYTQRFLAVPEVADPEQIDGLPTTAADRRPDARLARFIPNGFPSTL